MTPAKNHHTCLAASMAGQAAQVNMIDLHSHLLPGLDDGAADLGISLAMARAYVEQGVECVACTPHILPGLYANTGPEIKAAVADLQVRIAEAGIPLRIVSGADNHIVPDFAGGLDRGHLLPLAGSAYVLVEPPHHVLPARLEDLFFSIAAGGYVPILTHPERLTWIETKYDLIRRLAASGVWMQITSGSLLGRFGRRPRYWAERILDDGLAHILATDAHNMASRPPDLLEGRKAAERILGSQEAGHLTVTRPLGILSNKLPHELVVPHAGDAMRELPIDDVCIQASGPDGGGLGQRLRRLLG